MGIVLKQSLKNTVITYFGFGIGAINTLFLYTRFLTDEYYGLVAIILSTSAILMPLFAFGVQNTMVKYYSGYKKQKNQDGFLMLMLVIPLIFIVPAVAITYYAFDMVGDFLARKNPILKGYVWYIFLIGMAMAYFEIFYAWAKVQMKSVFGNFLKEVFCRLGVLVLLCLVYVDFISVTVFLKALVVLYLLRMVIMKLYAFKLKFPKLSFQFPKNTYTVFKYSAIIIIGSSAAVILLEIDRFMINQYVDIKNVAYYSVAIFIATIIEVPSRAMHQITYPLTAEILNTYDMKALKQLYQKSSLSLFIVSGLLFMLIILNINDLYHMLPEEYRGGFTVVFLIGLIKVYNSLIGNNNAILYNSEYYRTVLVIGILLAILAIVFNMWFIPIYGVNGAAIATFFALMLYNTFKLVYVKIKFNIQPFSSETLKVLAILLTIGLPFYFLPFAFHPIVNIIIKSIVVAVLFIGLIYQFRISEDISTVISKIFKKS